MAKQKYILYTIPVVIAAAVAAYFIFSRSRDAYLSMLPKDATALARLDVKELIDDADLNTTELYQLVTSSNDNPETAPLGIDVQQPIYAFMTASGNVGFAAAVSDVDELCDRLDEMRARAKASERTSQRGYDWVVLGGQWLMAFDSRKALVMGPAAGAAQEAVRAEMATLLEQKRKDSGVGELLYTTLQNTDEPLTAVVAPEVLPFQARTLLYKLGIRTQNDALLTLTLGFDDNEVELDAHILAQTATVKENLKKLNSALRPLTTKNIGATHADNVAWMAVNVHGKSLVEFLRSHNTTRTALVGLNMIFDLDQMLNAIDGDVALELLSPAAFTGGFNLSDIRDFCFTAQLSNADFMQRASTWGNDVITFEALSPNDYSLRLMEQELFFGTDANSLYVSSSQGLPSEGNAYLREQRDDIDDCRFYATFFTPALFSALLSQAASNGVAVPLPPVFQQFQRLNIEMEEADELKVTLVAPKGVNVAKELIHPKP